MNEMKRHSIFLAILFLFIAPTVHAVGKKQIVGHMKPLSSELLAHPIHLQCGETIREWRGTHPTPKLIQHLNVLCNKAIAAFLPFLKTQNLKAPHFNHFKWNLSLSPDGSCYRCMNDVNHRFYNRFFHNAVWGYTTGDKRYTFMISNTHRKKEPSFDKIFTHELFHAMSYASGLYDSYPEQYLLRTDVDEEFAHKFTAYMGYGK